VINLLPTDFKKQLRAARNNNMIRRYYMLLIMSAGLLALVFAVGFMVTLEQEAQHNKIKEQTEKTAQTFQKTRDAAEDFSKDLAVAKTILAIDVRFSKLITDIASVIPPGVILRNLSLDTQDESSKTPITINASSKTYEDAVKLKNSLEESPIFESVSLVSAGTGTADGSAYPVSTTVSVKFTKTTEPKEAKKP